MNEIIGRVCNDCGEVGHSSMDCPKISMPQVITSSQSRRSPVQRHNSPPVFGSLRSKSAREHHNKLRSKPRRSNHVLPPSMGNTSPLQIQIQYRKDAVYPVPKYRSDEDLRFSITRTLSNAPKKKRRKKNDDEKKDYLHSITTTPDEDEELFKDGGSVKVRRGKKGTVVSFGSDDDDEDSHTKGRSCPPVEPVKSTEKISHAACEKHVMKQPSHVSDKGDSTKSEVKGDSSAESNGEKENYLEQNNSSSDSPSSESSSSSESDDSSSDSSPNEEGASFIDIRDKYNDGTSLSELRKKLSSESSKRMRPISDDSDRGSEKIKKHVKKRTKTEPETYKTSATREELLRNRSDDDYESFSDDGETTTTHDGALATVQPVKRPPKIVPIFPFKCHSRYGQFPESKVPFIDSHCHIDYLFVRDRNYGSFASFVESKDFPKNFSGCVANFCDPPAWGEYQMYEEILEEDGVWGAFGLHPHNAHLFNAQILKNLIRAAKHEKCVAWGEMGLDYGNKNKDLNPYTIDMQKDAFMAQIAEALKLQLPLVIHGRGAESDCFEILKEKVPRDYKIHFHCYTGVWAIAKEMIDYFPNMFLGITGLVTYSTATDVREVCRKCPLDKILVETDAPYMKPSNASSVDKDSPRTASPAMGLWVAHKIAEIRKIDLDDVLKQVRQNVKDMYGI